MKRRLLLAAASGSALALIGCSTQQIDDYRAEQPVLDLAQYFNGTLDAYGIFTDRSGTVVQRFTVVLRCSWQGDQGVLDEDFRYADGRTQKRVWHLTRLPDGRYSGSADDVVGQAQGQTRGNALHWTYTLRLPVDGSVYAVQFDDWMYQLSDKVVLNKATMRKWGVRLGEVTLSFHKR